MRLYPSVGLQVADILLPRPRIDLRKWAVIACDQFTSEPEYWNQVREIVGNSPSTYNLILPEVLLGTVEEQERIQSTQRAMQDYLDQQILMIHEGLIYVEREIGGRTRHGLMLALDLEKYDFSKGSQSMIRATEGTILDRLPPRIRIREGAPVELPHILVLIDDPDRTVIEPIRSAAQELPKLYDFELMLGSGHLRGYFVNNPALEKGAIHALEQLASPERFHAHYGVPSDKGVLLYAVGDGNHSLATAKSIWEKMKPSVGMNHPARYALIELENVHDEGLEFKPIHRVIFNVRENVYDAMITALGNIRIQPCSSAFEMIGVVERQAGAEQAIGIITREGCKVVWVEKPTSNLPVGTLQTFLDPWLKQGGAEKIDYVHGSEAVTSLGSQSGNMGFYLPPMPKNDLFKTVILDGALPRKTFSMGEAEEKRFYMEARRIA